MIRSEENLKSKLKSQHAATESWDKDPILHTILSILGGPLNEDNYKGCKVEDAKEIVREALISISLFANTKKVGRILRHVNKLETTKDVVLYLGEIILRD